MGIDLMGMTTPLDGVVAGLVGGGGGGGGAAGGVLSAGLGMITGNPLGVLGGLGGMFGGSKTKVSSDQFNYAGGDIVFGDNGGTVTLIGSGTSGGGVSLGLILVIGVGLIFAHKKGWI